MKLKGYKNKKRGITKYGIGRIDPLYQLWKDGIFMTVDCLVKYPSISITINTIDKVNWIELVIETVHTLRVLDEQMTDKQRSEFKDDLFCRIQPYRRLTMPDVGFDGTRKSCDPKKMERLLLKLLSDISYKIPGITIDICDKVAKQRDSIIVSEGSPNTTIQPSLNDEQQKEECERNFMDDEIITLVCSVAAWFRVYDESFNIEDEETDYNKKKFNVISSACDLCLSLLEFSKRGNLGDHILFQDKLLSQRRSKQKLWRFKMLITKDDCHPIVVYSDILCKTQRLAKILLDSPIRFDTDLLVSMKFESEPDKNSVEYLNFVLDKCEDFASQAIIQRSGYAIDDLVSDVLKIRRYINDSNKLNVFNKCKHLLYAALDGVKTRNVCEVSLAITKLLRYLVTGEYTQYEEERIGIKNEENESEIDETDDDDFC